MATKNQTSLNRDLRLLAESPDIVILLHSVIHIWYFIMKGIHLYFIQTGCPMGSERHCQWTMIAYARSNSITVKMCMSLGFLINSHILDIEHESKYNFSSALSTGTLVEIRTQWHAKKCLSCMTSLTGNSH